MRILFGANPVPFHQVGGLLTQILNTKKYLEKMGVAVELFNGWEPFDSKKFDLFHLFWANLSTHFLGTMMKEQGLKMVVSPVFFSRHSPRVLAGIHTFGKVLSRVKSIRLGHMYTSELCQLSDMNLPNSKREALLLQKGLGVPENKIRVIPNGVEERFYSADPSLFKKRHGIENFILYVGHIGSGRKNTLRLVKVLKKINHPAVLIGPVVKGSYSDLCLEEARKSKNILILPSLENDSPLLESAYAACEVFVLPSLFETPGIAALEAGLAGAKVVITPYGGTEEYFEDLAEYVDPKSERSINNGIVRALNKKRDDRLKEHIHKNFLWERVAKETVKVYEELVSQRG
ncbi:glycosyltransferase family 4 protein [candidate division TA06 bacterium]|nr:glycosyltransferase family 4 protein [candidate division TA06 bacterium]